MSQLFIKTRNLHKTFVLGRKPSQIEEKVLKGVNLTIHKGDFAIIYGPSGCGKSTLLNLILGLEDPTEGAISVNGIELGQLSEEEKTKLRAKKFGIVYQQPLWIRSLSVLDNVAISLSINNYKLSLARFRAKKYLAMLKMNHFINYLPQQLSGGQQAKAGVARALVNDPAIIIADEPTGNLDSKSADELMYLFTFLNRHLKRTIILVTHNLSYLSIASKKIAMADGKVTTELTKVKEQIKKEIKGLL